MSTKQVKVNLSGRRQGKSVLMKTYASLHLDAGKPIRYVSINDDVIIKRINGVDFIVNKDGSMDIEGKGLLKL